MLPRHGFIFVSCATSVGVFSLKKKKVIICAFLKEIMNNSILRKEA